MPSFARRFLLAAAVLMPGACTEVEFGDSAASGDSASPSVVEDAVAGATVALPVEGAASTSSAAPMPADEGMAPGTFIAAEQTWDSVRDGLSLVLTYDDGVPGFVGMVTNDAPSRRCDVQVAVELENGPRLTPTTPVDLGPGEAHPVELPSDGEPVLLWSASASARDCG